MAAVCWYSERRERRRSDSRARRGQGKLRHYPGVSGALLRTVEMRKDIPILGNQLCSIVKSTDIHEVFEGSATVLTDLYSNCLKWLLDDDARIGLELASQI